MKTLLIIITCFIATIAYSQSITNTLGTNGIFTIKDGTTTFYTLTQSTGQINILKTLRLENTTGSAVGVIFKGTERFIHNYGSSNSFFGVNSGNFVLTGSNNTGLGYNSLYTNTTGSENSASGYNTLYLNTTGSKNTASGNLSMFNNNIGANNTAYGYNSLYYNTSGTENTAIGYLSLFNSNTSAQNTAIGSQSLYSNNTGTQNTAIGVNAGFSVTTGSNLTVIGFNSSPSSGTATNQITLGNSSVTVLRCNTSTITTLSDVRDKKNITNLTLGLDFISKLTPRQFNWDKREWYDDNISDGTKMQLSPTAGFIAQELDAVQSSENAEWLNLVLKDNPEKFEATAGNLLPIMVKAIQELKTENDLLKTEVSSLKNNEERIAKLEQMIIELNKLLEVKQANN